MDAPLPAHGTSWGCRCRLCARNAQAPSPLLEEVGHGRSEDARGLGNRALLSGQWLEPTYEFRALQDGSRTLLYWQWLEGWRRSLHIVMRSRALLFGQWLELEARLQRLQLVFKSTAIQQW